MQHSSRISGFHGLTLRERRRAISERLQLTPGDLERMLAHGGLSEAIADRIVENLLVNNGTAPDPTSPFAFAASDLGLLTLPDAHGNCYQGNLFTTSFFLSAIGSPLPACP